MGRSQPTSKDHPASVGDDASSVTFSCSGVDMSTFMEEVMAARQQMQLMNEGRGDEVSTTDRQRQALHDFSRREVSPYFSKGSHQQNKLHHIAQQIKAGTSGPDSYRRSKATISKDGGSKSHSGNDADDDAGYVTANQEQQQPTGPIIPAMMVSKERKHFLGCETGEDAFSKASRRAL